MKKYAQTEALNQPETAEVQPHAPKQKEKGRRVDAQIVLGEVGHGNSSSQPRQKNRPVNKGKAVVVDETEMDDSESSGDDESDDSDYSIRGIHFDDSEEERDLGDDDDDGFIFDDDMVGKKQKKK